MFACVRIFFPKEAMSLFYFSGGCGMKKFASALTLLLCLSLFHTPALAIEKLPPDAISIDAPSAILIEAETGEIIYEKEAYAHRAPASVTKIMTMLLAAEAVDSGAVSLDEPVIASAKAAGMGGSQIWLEEGETMSFGEMLKCVTVVSANDCCVAIAEHLAGSEEAFAAKMNARAAELGLKDSNFLCCSGLSDSDEHYSCAHDLAVISRELLRHEFIKDFTCIWTDSIRSGEFGLSNTNKLIYHYPGATGLKTGFTSKAMHCLAASAERDGTEYIAVVLGAPSSAARFENAKTLLDHAFAAYRLVSVDSLSALPPLKVNRGRSDSLSLRLGGSGKLLTEKEDSASLSCVPELPEEISAPVSEGQQIGTLKVYSGDKLLSELPIVAGESIEQLGLFEIFGKIVSSVLSF